jgi:hypothetical protein
MDVALYESRRIWWTSVTDLLRSHRVLEHANIQRPSPPPLFDPGIENES